VSATIISAAALVVTALIAGLFQMNATNRSARRQAATELAAQNKIISGNPADATDDGLAGAIATIQKELQDLKAVAETLRTTIESRDATIRSRDATIADRDATVRQQQADTEENRRQMEHWMDLLVQKNPGLLKTDPPPPAATSSPE
jgi:peptidoglycan hydrolase CwlO-like protein